jgi:hypothetical protein
MTFQKGNQNAGVVLLADIGAPLGYASHAVPKGKSVREEPDQSAARLNHRVDRAADLSLVSEAKPDQQPRKKRRRGRLHVHIAGSGMYQAAK